MKDKILEIQKEFGIKNSGMAKLMGISLTAYNFKKNSIQDQKITNENFETFKKNFESKYKKIIK